MGEIKAFLKKEMVLIVAMALALLTSLFVKPKLEDIDFKVLILLFNLMIVVSAFKEFKLLDYMAMHLLKRCRSERITLLSLVFMTFTSAMFMTNDVALITFVPFTLIIGQKIKKDMLKWIVFQTLAANLGSALTPMGNPQNLYIYTHYNVNNSAFLKAALPIMALGIVFLLLLIFREKNRELTFEMEEIFIKNKLLLSVYVLLFLIVLVSVFKWLDYRIAFFAVVSMSLLLKRDLFKRVDYSLLLTFIGFFIFVGNLSSVQWIKEGMEHFLRTPLRTYIGALGLSQIISNVPATMLLSRFTQHWEALLYGVDVGGMGTLIASLASVISYKLYVSEHKEKGGAYLKCFTIYNAIGLLGFGIAFIFLFL